MNKLSTIAIAAFAALFVATIAVAQPGLGITKTAPLSGKGSVADPLKITMCANGEGYVSNGTSWTCATAGDITSVGATSNMGLTGGASSGAALLGLRSTCSDGQVLKSGASGTTWTCADDSDTTYTAGDNLTLTALDFDLDPTIMLAGAANSDTLTVSGTGAGQTLTDSALIRANGGGTFDTTAADRFYAAIVAIADATRSAGSNALVNTGVYAEASGGQTNTSLYVYQSGVGSDDWAVFGDGKSRFTSTLQVDGNVTINGNTTLGNASTDATSTVGTVSVTSTATAQSASRTLLSIADSGTFTTAAADRVAVGVDSLSTNTVSTGTNTLYSIAIRGRANTDTSTNFETAIGVYGSAEGTNTFGIGVYASASGTNSYSLFTEDRPVVFSDSMLHSFGTAPSLSSCGGSPTITGTNQAGKIVTGSAATGCVLTFASPAWISSDVTCVLTARGGGVLPTYTPSSSTLTLNTAAASATYDYWCSATSNGTSVVIP